MLELKWPERVISVCVLVLRVKTFLYSETIAKYSGDLIPAGARDLVGHTLKDLDPISLSSFLKK